MNKESIFLTTKIKGMIIKGKFLPPTNKKDSRAKVIHKRDSKTTYSKTIKWNSDIDAVDNYYNACLELLKEWELKEYNDNLEVLAIGYDHDHYYFIVNSKVF
mgnify:CR=1 FL=1|tara:strand:- start:92 stop:397 length:306 start_codon:yes stop_codon:yes gene_type:complete